MTRWLQGLACGAVLGCALVAPVGLWAQSAPATDFTFHMVKVPPPGSSRRITVQIDPAEQAAMLAARPATPPSAPEEPATPDAAAPAPVDDWFWSQISPRLADSGPGRLDPALRALSAAPAGQQVPQPRLQDLQAIASAHGREILAATVGTQVSPALVLAVISVESSGETAAVSKAGAQGLMQLMPDTATRFGVADSLAASDNIKGGVAYLDFLMTRFARDPILVLAGYNAGEGAIRDNSGVPDFPQTRSYVPKVLAAWQVARGLCMTPPELMTDGCVFAVNGG
ncbi:MAG: transglycosylase SLT domain-containing protein [Limimaricola sp.]|uniref:lytic transglycosylase domain-containing protein n=1 Tax=Limimaricola sp. TaxID=2211665 RepID=UPI001DA0FC4D|nr:lytic transglycosylase domain-containing protein [Limimaricola sp.]MBI1419020.1 transglycosylase SLT domain-containing protein [Limimaricola sp.]